MTRKDYELIAGVIRKQAEANKDSGPDQIRLYSVACDLAVAFADENSRFDMQRFLVATGFHG